MSKLRTISICLSDIPKEKMHKSEKNGKVYINLTTYDNDSPDKFGNDFSVWVSQSKEERDAKAQRSFVGNGKIFNNTTSANSAQVKGKYDDLPF